MYGSASIIPFLWPLLFLSLSLEHQIKAVSPVFTTTPYFTFTYQKITSLFVVWTRKSPNITHFISCDGEMDSQTWHSWHTLLSPHLPRVQSLVPTPRSVSAPGSICQHVSRVTCLTAPCLSVRLFVCVHCDLLVIIHWAALHHPH